MAIARRWDGAGYDRVSTQMEVMGREVLDRLPLRGNEHRAGRTADNGENRCSQTNAAGSHPRS